MIVVAATNTLAATGARITNSFDTGWRFLQQDISAAMKPDFDDSTWRQLDVPYDWSIESAASRDNPSGGAGGYFVDGVGWYRKQFTLDESDSAKRIFVDFDSVMANSDVWINGHLLGHRPNGYVPLHYELTGFLNFGQGKSNVLAVRVDESAEPASRYYTGGGIIGHVKLLIVNSVHFEHDGLFVTTPKIGSTLAVVHVQATVVNQSDGPRSVAVRFKLIDPQKQNQIATVESSVQSVAAGKSLDVSRDISVNNPSLWDLDHPQLYRVEATLMDGALSLDDDATTFGIRSIKFASADGFSLNGKNVRIQGVCLHADGSCFGTAVPIGVWEKRLAALKPFGVNAIRTAHNPPSPEFLELCDRMGFLVMDEMFDCWDVAKNKFDYHLYFDQWSLIDLRDAVRRDRNHPSIILYSAGNEIHDTPKAAPSLKILSRLVKEFHDNDPTRPVTQALLRPNVSHDYTDGLADLLDVVGTNYRMKELLAAQQAKPTRLIIGTENHLSDVSFLAEHPQLAGIFLWAGADYLGEAREWPQFSDGSGILDRTNQPKAAAYFARATWTHAPFVHIARGVSKEVAIKAYTPGVDGDEPVPTQPTDRRRRRPVTTEVGSGPIADWTPANQQPHTETVWIYSNCAKVELTLNGVSVPGSADAAGLPNGTKIFSVPFAPGILKATGSDVSGNAVATDELRTAGPAAKLVLTPDMMKLPHDWDDVARIQAAITDENGVTLPLGDHEISFTLTGPGVIAATDSADNKYHEPFTSAQRLTFQGRCFAMIKSNADFGTILVTASTPGLPPATVTLAAAPMAR